MINNISSEINLYFYLHFKNTSAKWWIVAPMRHVFFIYILYETRIIYITYADYNDCVLELINVVRNVDILCYSSDLKDASHTTI